MAFNLHKENIDQGPYCDTCYWRNQYESLLFKLQDLLERFA